MSKSIVVGLGVLVMVMGCGGAPPGVPGYWSARFRVAPVLAAVASFVLQ